MLCLALSRSVLVAFITLLISPEFILFQVAAADQAPLMALVKNRHEKQWVQTHAGSEEILRIAVDDASELPGDISLLVQYRNRRGRKVLKRLCRNTRSSFNSLKRQKIVAVERFDKDKLKVILNDPNIEFVETNHKVHALLPPRRAKKKSTDEGHIRHLKEKVNYGIEMVQVDQMWKLRHDGEQAENMTICIIDSGMALGHPDLPSEGVTGTNTGIGDWRSDPYGHGTHCAGTIAAIGDNDIGVKGILQNSSRFRLHIARVLDQRGDGSELLVLKGLESCVAAGAKVVSMSIGGSHFSETAQKAFKEAYDAGVLLVAASGNAGNTEYSYPASLPSVMSVAAVERDRGVASFSQYNDQVEIAGPGVDIYSTVSNLGVVPYGYDSWSGTSMATPFVASVAALVWSHFKECSNQQIRNVLILTASDIGRPGCDVDAGFGIVQAKAAYDLLKEYGCAAGGDSPDPLSDGAFGGCQQDPSYTTPPTSTPTQFLCDQKEFLLNLTTDEWGAETSWKLVDSDKNIVESGRAYRSSQNYIIRLCLPLAEYTFTILDAENDGICCNNGEGFFELYFDGALVGVGGNFATLEEITFGRNPTALPPSDRQPCVDDEAWAFTKNGSQKSCQWVGAKPDMRCKSEGVDGSGMLAKGQVACPVACKTCKDVAQSQSLYPTSTPTLQPLAASSPSGFPTPSPTLWSTKQPTLEPTSSPTQISTSKPTYTPTKPPTEIPTGSPTLTPSVSPSERPTEPPTLPPTVLPTESPSLMPTVSPTDSPTVTLTLTPSIKTSELISCTDRYGDDIELCQESESECRFFVKFPEEQNSCYNFCASKGGVCLSAFDDNVDDDVCKGNEEKSIFNQLKSVICVCSRGEKPKAESTPCTDKYGDRIWVCQESESECRFVAEFFGEKNSCSNFCKANGGVCLSAFDDDVDVCVDGDIQSCYDKKESLICTCSLGEVPPKTQFTTDKYGYDMYVCNGSEADKLKYFAALEGDSCNDFCKKRGRKCGSAEDNVGDTCETDGKIDCEDTGKQASLCTCKK